MRWIFAVVLSVSLVGCFGRGPIHPNAVELNRTGAQALAHGDLEVAAARFSLALEYNPGFVEAWINLGLVELARGDLEGAERRFRRALSLDKDAAGAHVGLGAIAEKRGDPALAEKHYRAALAIDPGLAEPRANLGRLLAARGAYDEAREHFLRLVEVQAGDTAGWVGLVEVLLRMDRDAEAADVAERAYARFGPGVPEIELVVARVEMARGAWDAAIARLAPLAPAPTAVGRAAGGWLAFAYLMKGDREAAKKAAKAVLARDPDDTLAKHVLAKANEAPAQ
ncbi:MAG: tetratricopeptide repeat protein [Myxococcales bacterium]|nr:tetratricopeptide repeat protein [Myxococcales bacterium]